MITSDDDHPDRTPNHDFVTPEPTRIDLLCYRTPRPAPAPAARRGTVYAGRSVRQVSQVAGEIDTHAVAFDLPPAGTRPLLRTWR